MPTRTQRILDRLPKTFRVRDYRSPLYAVVDAFGQDFLNGENALTEIMASHFVELADKGQDDIRDLAKIAALYGLTPRDDETVEEFREHLLRYVRTFLEGTVTVQGILRITAESVGLRIADDYADLDTWWKRGTEVLTTYHPRGEDAATLLFGIDHKSVRGQSARPARVAGDVSLENGVDLSDGAILRLRVNDRDPVEIDLAQDADDITTVQASDILTAINTAVTFDQPLFKNFKLANLDERGQLVLTAPRVPDSLLEVMETPDDAAPAVLGLLGRVFQPQPADAATITDTIDLSGGVDMGAARYLRFMIDSARIVEVDTGGGRTSLDAVRDAINTAIGEDIASHDGTHLILTSPTTGAASSLVLQSAASQDARRVLLGDAPSVATGRDDRPAILRGLRDIRGGVDLSENNWLNIKLGDFTRRVNIAGPDPSQTTGDQIAATLNAVLGGDYASFNGRVLTLTAPPDTTLTLLGDEGDAAGLVFGTRSRLARSVIGGFASMTGLPKVDGYVNLHAQHVLKLSIDGDRPIEIDLYDGLENIDLPADADPIDIGKVSLAHVAAAINHSVGMTIASATDTQLSLTSPSSGGVSQIAVLPLQTAQQRRFVSRAIVTDEAAREVFGFVHRHAQGQSATRAIVTGTARLDRGVDLSERRFLRLSIDGSPMIEVNCAGRRPRATLITEIVASLHAAFPNGGISEDGEHITISSATVGLGSRIVFEPSRAIDALPTVLGLEPGLHTGRGVTDITLTGTVDLGNGVDLSGGSKVVLTRDGGDPTTVDIAEYAQDITTVMPNEIVNAFNLTFAARVAGFDGQRLAIASGERGAAAQLAFTPAPDGDATAAILGFTPPRTYTGDPPLPTVVRGEPRSGAFDMQDTRALLVAIDGADALQLNCVPEGTTPTDGTLMLTLSQVAGAINTSYREQTSAAVDIATVEDERLVLTSPTMGVNSRIRLLANTGGDARDLILGDVPDETIGDAPTAATITSEIAAGTPVNLSKRRVLRLKVDNGHPVDVDVAGDSPRQTTADFIASQINAAYRDRIGMEIAFIEDDKLVLRSPLAGMHSHIEVMPLRYLELIEYPVTKTDLQPVQMVISNAEQDQHDHPARFDAKHGERIQLDNLSPARTHLELALTAPQGTTRPALMSLDSGLIVRVHEIVDRGETLTLTHHPRYGVHAEITDADGVRRRVPQESLYAGPVGYTVDVPLLAGEVVQLNGGNDDVPFVLLNNPLAPETVKIKAHWHLATLSPTAQREVQVSVRAATQGFDPANLRYGTTRLYGVLRTDQRFFYLTPSADDDAHAVRVVADDQTDLADYVGHRVVVDGRLVEGDRDILHADRVCLAFDVTVQNPIVRSDGQPESYRGVTIGDGPDAPNPLTSALLRGASRTLRAERTTKSEALGLPRGRSTWIYMDGAPTRYARTQQDGDDRLEYMRQRVVEQYRHGPFGLEDIDTEKYHGRFASGGSFVERGVFDASLFLDREAIPQNDVVPVHTVFASEREQPDGESNHDPAVQLLIQTEAPQGGAFIVNLPAELAARFGARFNEALFVPAQQETYTGVVMEPEDDPDYIGKHLEKSQFVRAHTLFGALPIGERAVELPFRKPVPLRLSRLPDPTTDPDAQPETPHLYVQEIGMAGGYIKIYAYRDSTKGHADTLWGSDVTISARRSGPAMYDITVSYQGARFENARQVVLGKKVGSPADDIHLPIKPSDLFRPGLVGILQAKAGGVHASVTRDRAYVPPEHDESSS